MPPTICIKMQLSAASFDLEFEILQPKINQNWSMHFGISLVNNTKFKTKTGKLTTAGDTADHFLEHPSGILIGFLLGAIATKSCLLLQVECTRPLLSCHEISGLIPKSLAYL